MTNFNIRRITKHLLTTHNELRRVFPPLSLQAIEQAIKASESSHLGEIRFVVEAALECGPLIRGQTARARAIDVFSQLHIWDTAHNNGVLIYLLLADRDVEIVADRGIHTRTSSDEWEQICRMMESAFKLEQYEQGAIRGIQAVSQHLTKHFPVNGDNLNELPDAVVIL
ncbi:TPM domain-containing protein [Undibacterium sp. CY18W]|uniref:TPM domain-containing protein n=1 Tax=Undibacterium hunanense TaxID=2762292 RepID=A0ABR6ZYR9_9BURK|nr:TPM domain-containing protein [Undibacterium hunanense]MBC3921010.1 TPM domain-containing protein [Undibacterium hunanense]